MRASSEAQAEATTVATPGIDRVVTELRVIVEHAIAQGTRDGYFASLYLNMTLAVKRGIEEGLFDDGPRMDRLDAVFAQRYLDAHAAYFSGDPVTRSWRVAFDSTRRWRPLILQQLLLGMNAHINLDLGIATAEIAGNQPLSLMRSDFDRINGIIASLTDRTQTSIAASAPLLSVLDLFAGRSDELLADFSIQVARDGAFQFAERLAGLPPDARAGAIVDRDHKIAALGAAIARPGLLLSAATLPLRLLERGAPSQITRRLL